MRCILAAVLLSLLTGAAQAQTPPRVFGGAVSLNGIWFDDPEAEVRNDLEAGLNARASLSPHISLVGSGVYGIRNKYFRYSAGVRVTATDVDNQAFSVGLGLQYRGSGYYELKPDEWAPDASVGWRPWPQLPDVVLVAQGWYGIESDKAGALAGIRYVLPF